ncbi:MAG: stage II sporulation protein R [Bacilli bacterium]|nr:stage II sporulation protein R [Bacilli bacterium]
MRKAIIILAIIITVLSLNKASKVIIPKEAIRFRVIANSNKEEDQLLKKEIIKNLSPEIVESSKAKNIEEARKYLKNNLPKFEEIVNKTLEEKSANKEFNINYGKNYFPKKEYKDIIYEAGEYESLVIKLGEGSGKNFWCVLFPPLCLVDEDMPNVKYKSLIKELIDKYF